MARERVFDLEELLEDAALVTRVDADAGVAHREPDRAVAARTDFDVNGAAIRRELDRVLKDCLARAAEIGAIRVHHRRAIDGAVHRQRNAPIAGWLLERSEQPCAKFFDREGLDVLPILVGFEVAKVDELVDLVYKQVWHQ